ncbi:hypothetical protein [Telmatospirillum siberiense]|uniref:Uncharacterized protein n=1 Tax=Telmatospirillum siberiense TaxID=382514 RepID=A0A2N3Q1G7_9PROT|nr:hypothetical protein [Telmatospirillum siberiense]PKU26483.1 hypothetical protein CWS72_01155 [Telmatospirillum siberiense]
MTDGTTTRPLEIMRTLASLIDPSIEALLDSHGFMFVRMHIADHRAQALFCTDSHGSVPPWHLTMTAAAEGGLTLSLVKSLDEQPQLSLTILVGTPPAASLAEAVGLAVSFALMSDQMQCNLSGDVTDAA